MNGRLRAACGLVVATLMMVAAIEQVKEARRVLRDWTWEPPPEPGDPKAKRRLRDDLTEGDL